MALYTLPKQYHPDFSAPNKKPVESVELDSNNYLTKNIIFDANFIGSQAFDLVTNSLLTNNGASFGVTGEAESQYTSIDDDSFSIVGLDRLAGSDYTVIIRTRIEFFDTSGVVLFGWNDNGAHFFQMGGQPTEAVVAGKLVITSSVVVDDNAYHNLYFVSDSNANEVRVYLDGLKIGTAAGAQSVPSGAKTVHIGRWIGGVNWSLEGGISRVQVLDRSITDAEAVRIENDRYQHLKPKIPSIYFTAAGVAPSISIPVIMHSYKQRRV